MAQIIEIVKIAAPVIRPKRTAWRSVAVLLMIGQVEIDRGDGRAGVHRAGQVRHDRGDQPGHHQSREPRRQKLLDERGKHHVGLGQVATDNQRRDQPRHDVNQRQQHLQVVHGDHAHPGVPLVLGRQAALHDELVGRVVKHADADDAAEKHGPGERRVGGGQQQVPIVAPLRQSANPSDVRMPNGLDRQDGPAAHQDDELEHFGPDDGPQAAGDRVDRSEHGQRDDRLPNLNAGNERMDRQSAEEQHGGDFHENVRQKDQYAVDHPRRAAEPAVEELGHGVEAVAEVEGQEYPQQGEKAGKHGGPGDVHRREAQEVGRAHDAHEMVARYVRGDNAAADHPPGQLVAGQEVVALGGGGSTRRAETQPQHEGDVDGKDADVEAGQFHSARCRDVSVVLLSRLLLATNLLQDQGHSLLPVGRDVFGNHQAEAARPGIGDHL